jgi:hypothetical protein
MIDSDHIFPTVFNHTVRMSIISTSFLGRATGKQEHVVQLPVLVASDNEPRLGLLSSLINTRHRASSSTRTMGQSHRLSMCVHG